MPRSFRALLLAATAVPLVVIVACVGDDPGENNPAPANDSGTPPGQDATSGTDSNPPSVPDSEADTSTSGDGAPCDLTQPFGTPKKVNGTGTASRGALANDERTIYLAITLEDASALQQVGVATRPTKSDAFGPATEVMNLSSVTDDRYLAVTPDDLHFVVAHPKPGIADYQLFASHRNSTNVPFPPPTELGVSDPVGATFAPSLTADGSRLFFNSTRTGTLRLYEATSANNFGTAKQITELSTIEGESFPVISSDALTVYFASSRPGGAGSTDVWVAKRNSTSELFGAVKHLPEVATAEEEYPIYISANGCRLYFGRRNVGLYFADRP